MSNFNNQKSIVLLFLIVFLTSACRNDEPQLANDRMKLSWLKTDDGWRLQTVEAKAGEEWHTLPNPSGAYTLLYSSTKPVDEIDSASIAASLLDFPEPAYHYLTDRWKENLLPVAMNTAGEAFFFYPEEAQSFGDSIVFQKSTTVGDLKAVWQPAPDMPGDVLVTLELTASQDGYYSMASSSLSELPAQDIQWGMIPGLLQGDGVQSQPVLAYAYGQGIPDHPIVFQERTASTLSPMLTSKNGVTQAVVPLPGYARDPWEKDKETHEEWQLGLSLMNRKGAFTPTLYYPVLGKEDSYLKAGETVRFQYYYVMRGKDWFEVLNHVAYDMYDFGKALKLRKNKRSLTQRILAMHNYVTSDQTSLWRIEQFKGNAIGAQAYLGGVVGSDKDAMKNSDYGAMWMLAAISDDETLKKKRLPYARNFKLSQQNTEEGFFEGAAAGQYYLSKSKKFTEEWGSYVEPIALTYYVMLDIGNMLLFKPNDEQLKKRLKLGAERLMEWQHEDGHWGVAYNYETQQAMFTELKDLRPTFYGLLVAYRILEQPEYLEAARQGADWLIKHSVNPGHFLGVCGDTRFAPDFATGQMAQSFLDLYDITEEQKYLDAAVRCAKIYTASVYTHPVPSTAIKEVKGKELQDWEISQSGLSFEHGGSIGSANVHGPILLASHAGMFIRMYQHTGDSLFRDMARAAAIGRDAFVDEDTKVASYYWETMDAGAGPYPHHAWWQIGWITDYLMSEIALRADNMIKFPKGFVTPKVGPHQCYGFSPGKIFGEEVNLYLKPGMLTMDNPSIEFMGARSTSKDEFMLILMNTLSEEETVKVTLNYEMLGLNREKMKNITLLDTAGNTLKTLPHENEWNITLGSYGLNVIRLRVG